LHNTYNGEGAHEEGQDGGNKVCGVFHSSGLEEEKFSYDGVSAVVEVDAAR
jgi:hypothetical protein